MKENPKIMFYFILSKVSIEVIVPAQLLQPELILYCATSISYA